MHQISRNQSAPNRKSSTSKIRQRTHLNALTTFLSNTQRADKWVCVCVYMQGHYVQTRRYEYSTHPLQPSRPRTQRPKSRPVWVHWPAMPFIATSKAACRLCFHQLGATLSCLGLCASMTSSIKLEVSNVSRCHHRTEPRPLVTCTKNLVKIGRVFLEICLQTGKNTQTDRHGHHNTPLPHCWRSYKMCKANDCIMYTYPRWQHNLK